jgi:hypothetical protein
MVALLTLPGGLCWQLNIGLCWVPMNLVIKKYNPDFISDG